MNSEEAHILFSCPDTFPDEYIRNVTDELNVEGLLIQAVKRPFGPSASVEWTILGVLAAFITKSYFESFLQEAGKDHYYLLKNWLKKIATDSRLIKVTTITATESTNKVNKTNSQSKTISIFIETKDNATIKLLFDVSLSDEVWRESIDTLLDLALDHYQNFPQDKLTKLTSDLEKEEGMTIYAIIDKDSKGWKFYDNRKIFDLMRNKKI